MRQRSTRQLTAIFQVLASSTDHPTAEQILERVRRVVPRVSLGTVYRNLDKLRYRGRVRMVWLGGGVAHYDAMLGPHDHFVCDECSSVIDLDCSLRKADARQLQRAGFVVRWQTTAVYGLCKSCAEARPGQGSEGARREPSGADAR